MECFDVEIGGFGFSVMGAWFGLLCRNGPEGKQKNDNECDEACLHGMIFRQYGTWLSFVDC
ncbi:MAG: hypothetical protein IH899_02280 [Planctomycetes bacterium]|nr:hypothetical protein [Planctomycetota bacterium]